MTEIDKNTFDRQKAEWLQFKHQEERGAVESRTFFDLLSMADKLKEAGLDLSQDETYEFIHEDLDKAQFNEALTLGFVSRVVFLYTHGVLCPTSKYVNETNKMKATHLKEIVDRAFPLAAKFGIDLGQRPSTASDMLWQNFNLLVDAYENGMLEKELKQSSNLAAQEYYRDALGVWERCKENVQKGKKLSSQDAKSAFSAAKNALEAIDKAGAAYSPTQMVKEFHDFDGYLDPSKGVVEFSREAVQGLKKEIFVAQMSQDYATAIEFQDRDGAYVLDISGGGFGANVLPLHEIVEKLKAEGFDITQDATYQMIGTDKTSFTERYNKERTEASKSEFKDLVKPALL